MDIESAIQNIAAEQGWTDATVGSIALGFLLNTASSEVRESFVTYVREIQQTENGSLSDEDGEDAPAPHIGLFVSDDTELPEVPDDFPVRPLGPNDPATDPVTCVTCGLSWDDAISTSMTPAPSGRCPFEYFH